MDENQNVVNQVPPAAEPPKKATKGWLVGGCAAIGLLGIAAIVLFVIFDPFGLISLLFGGQQIAAIVPEDTSVFVEVDFSAWFSDDFQDIVEVFRDAADVEIEDLEDEFNDEFEDAFGVTLDDIKPWLGQYIGLAITDLDSDTLQGYDDPPVVFILTSRDKDAADEFIQDVVDHREDEYGDEFDEFEYEGGVFYDNEDDYDSFIIGRYKDFVLISTDVDSVEDIVDLAAEGRRADGTLAKSEMYKRAVDELPKDRMISIYLDPDLYSEISTELYDEMYPGIDFPVPGANADIAIGMAVEVVSEGIKFSAVTLYEDPDDLPWSGMEFDITRKQAQTLEMVPEETFLFISSYSPKDYFKTILDELDEDYIEALEMAADEIDVDMIDLLTSIEGEMAFAMFEQKDSILSEMLDTPLGMSMIIGFNDDGPWNDLFDMLSDLADEDYMLMLEEVDLEDHEMKSIILDDGSDEFPIILFGTGESAAILTTEVENPEILLGDGDTLADSERFQEVWKAFPKGSWPMLYVDLGMLIEFIEDVDGGSSELAVLEPLTAIAATSSMMSSEDSQIVTVLFFIER